MHEEWKLRHRMFKQLDEATNVAAITTTTMNHRDLKAGNEGMEPLYNICTDIDEIITENEHKKTTSPPKGTKEQVFKFFVDQLLKKFTKYEFRPDLDQLEIGIGNYLSFQKSMLRDFKFQLHDII